jgi:hypothetical protein
MAEENEETNEWKKISKITNKAALKEKGDEVTGKLLEISDSPYGTKVYIIEQEGGENATVFGTTVLDDRMSNVEIGQEVKIIYQGTAKTTSGRTCKLFDVFVK